MRRANRTGISDAVRIEVEELYVRNRETVLKAAVRIIKELEDAEDVLQNIFIRLMRSAGDHPEKLDAFRKNPRAYLYKAAVREALHVKDAWKRQRISDEDFEELAIVTPGPDSEQAEYFRLIREAMETIDPAAAELLSLRYVEGYTYLEIGRLQDKGPAAVGMQLWRARSELTEAISRRGGMR